MLKKLSVIVLSAALLFGANGVNAAEKKSPYWQCVTFARSITGMQIFGDAWTWWAGATGKYEKGFSPKSGAVLVFRPQGKMKLGHVAVVSQVVTERIIQITHANWSPINGSRGQVEQDVTVVDVSDKGDWSKVKVWYGPISDLGTTVYPTYGFIYQAAQKGQEMGQNLVTQVLEKPSIEKTEKAAIATSSKVKSAALAEALTEDDTPRAQKLTAEKAPVDKKAPMVKPVDKADKAKTATAKAVVTKSTDKNITDKKAVDKKTAAKAKTVADKTDKTTDKAAPKKVAAKATDKKTAKTEPKKS